MIDEIRGDMQEAIAELRSLAHGIFPPLLASGGLAEALPATAARSPLAVSTDVSGVGRSCCQSSKPPCTSVAPRRFRTPASTRVDDASVTVHIWDDDDL